MKQKPPDSLETILLIQKKNSKHFFNKQTFILNKYNKNVSKKKKSIVV